MVETIAKAVVLAAVAFRIWVGVSGTRYRAIWIFLVHPLAWTAVMAALIPDGSIGLWLIWGLCLYGLFSLFLRDLAIPPVKLKSSSSNENLSSFECRRPRYDFSAVLGMSQLKEQALADIDDVLNKGKNGILFHGKPGTGKTFIAEAIAGEINRSHGKKLRFMAVNAASFQSKFIGESVERINKMFADARKQGPLVLFVDEAETALAERISDGTAGALYASQDTTTFLTHLTECREFKKSGVIVIAATNHLDRVDDAARRDGRFDFLREIPLPDYEARLGLINSRIPKGYAWASGRNSTENAAARAAKRWEGFNIPRIQNIVDEAAKIASKENSRESGNILISFDMLMAALRKIQGSMGHVLPESTLTLDQLGFDTDIKSQLSTLAKRMVDIERIEAMGGTVPKGVLFGGPAGTGKTAVAKALAKSAGWSFVGTSGNELLNDQTNQRLDQILDLASELRPCIVFIDEADDLIMDRANNPWGKSATNKLLEAMDGKRPLHDVMFIAATNFPDALDAAALRGGRFSEQFMFAAPSEETLTGIIRGFMKEKWMAPWAEDFTPEAAAGLLNGLAPADAKDRLQKAINHVVANEGTTITLADLRMCLG